jgi:hypothetical protein
MADSDRETNVRLRYDVDNASLNRAVNSIDKLDKSLQGLAKDNDKVAASAKEAGKALTDSAKQRPPRAIWASSLCVALAALCRSLD